MGDCPIIPYPEHPQLYWWIQMMQFYCTGLSTAFDALNRWTYSGRSIWHFERSGKCWQIHRKKDDDYDDDDDNGRSLLLLFIVSIVLSSLCVHVCCRDFCCHIVRMAALFIYAARVLIFNCTFYAAEFFLLCIYSIRYDIPFLFRSPSVGRWFRIIRNARWRIYNRVHSGTESLQIRASQKKNAKVKRCCFYFHQLTNTNLLSYWMPSMWKWNIMIYCLLPALTTAVTACFTSLCILLQPALIFFSPFFDSLFCSFIFFPFHSQCKQHILWIYLPIRKFTDFFQNPLRTTRCSYFLQIIYLTKWSLPNEFLCNLTHGRMSAVFCLLDHKV